jgi:hypothetical protein
MHRFWMFPLVLAIVGALYPFVTTMQGWLATFATIGLFASSSEINDSVVVGAPIGALMGVGIGIATASSDYLKHLTQDRSGITGANRLVGNLLWVGIYAGVLNLINAALVVVIVRSFVPPLIARFWMPAIPFLLFGLANLATISWAATRTAQTNDVLSPRLLLAKLRRSTQLEG